MPCVSYSDREVSSAVSLPDCRALLSRKRENAPGALGNYKAMQEHEQTLEEYFELLSETDK